MSVEIYICDLKPEVAGQVHAEQETGNDGRTIKQAGLLLQEIFCNCPLKEDAGCHRGEQYDC